jgi:hypothetical protein
MCNGLCCCVRFKFRASGKVTPKECLMFAEGHRGLGQSGLNKKEAPSEARPALPQGRCVQP